MPPLTKIHHRRRPMASLLPLIPTPLIPVSAMVEQGIRERARAEPRGGMALEQGRRGLTQRKGRHIRLIRELARRLIRLMERRLIRRGDRGPRMGRVFLA